MSEVFGKYYPEGNFNLWLNSFYQLGNRLTFLAKLNESKVKARLVLLNVINDYTYIKTSQDEWEKHYDEVFIKMTGSREVPDDVKVVYLKVNNVEERIGNVLTKNLL